MKRVVVLGLALMFGSALGLSVRGEVPGEPVVAEAETAQFSDAQLDLLLGPIALYPDPLLAELLPAATQPAEVVLAVRFLNFGGAPEQIEDQSWNESVKALAHYPEVIRWLDENLAWTTQLGEAYLKQPEAVMDTIQRLREVARSLGNLQSNAQQTVVSDEDTIEILPANPEVIYTPVYRPEVVFRQAAFSTGIFAGGALAVGAWFNHDWDWPNRRVIVWTKENSRPRNWWHQSRAERCQSTSTVKEWHPRPHQQQSSWWNAQRQQGHSSSPTAVAHPVQSPPASSHFTAGSPAKAQSASHRAGTKR